MASQYNGSRKLSVRYRYKSTSDAGFIELAAEHVMNQTQFFNCVLSDQGVERVEFQTRKSLQQGRDGGHFLEQNLLVYSKRLPSRSIEFGLTQHDHLKGGNHPRTVTACFKLPPKGLCVEAWLILLCITRGKELEPQQAWSYAYDQVVGKLNGCLPELRPSSDEEFAICIREARREDLACSVGVGRHEPGVASQMPTQSYISDSPPGSVMHCDCKTTQSDTTRHSMSVHDSVRGIDNSHPLDLLHSDVTGSHEPGFASSLPADLHSPTPSIQAACPSPESTVSVIAGSGAGVHSHLHGEVRSAPDERPCLSCSDTLSVHPSAVSQKVHTVIGDDWLAPAIDRGRRAMLSDSSSFCMSDHEIGRNDVTTNDRLQHFFQSEGAGGQEPGVASHMPIPSVIGPADSSPCRSGQAACPSLESTVSGVSGVVAGVDSYLNGGDISIDEGLLRRSSSVTGTLHPPVGPQPLRTAIAHDSLAPALDRCWKATQSDTGSAHLSGPSAKDWCVSSCLQHRRSQTSLRQAAQCVGGCSPKPSVPIPEHSLEHAIGSRSNHRMRIHVQTASGLQVQINSHISDASISVRIDET